MRKSIHKIFRNTFILIFFIMTSIIGKTQNVTGFVFDSQTGSGIPGVTVTVKGSQVATQTNEEGNFSIVSSGNGTLVFTAVNYTTLEMPVNNRSNLEVAMSLSTEKLTEVVVIGYGSVKKEDVTGAISTISTKDFQKGTITSFDQMIAGKSPGIAITSNGGHPGSGSVIRIRGLASLNGGNDPLIVVDGAPFSGYVNPNDIATVTILKDAASAAIYGSRASSGVILITTKKGKRGETQLNFNTQFSAGKISRYVDVLDAKDFREYITNNFDQDIAAKLGTSNTDWQKEIYQTAITTNNNLSISGAVGNLPYRISVGYLNQDGILKTDNMQRSTGSVSLTPSFLKNTLKLELNLNGSLTKNRNANQGAIGSAVAFDPTQSVHGGIPTFGNYFQWIRSDGTPNPLAPLNPVALLNQKHDISHFNRAFGNIKLDYSIPSVPGLHVIANLGADYGSSFGTTKIDSIGRENYQVTGNNVIYKGLNNKYDSKFENYFAEYTLNYNTTIESIKSNINAMITYGYYDEKGTNNNYASFDYKGDTLPNSKPKFLNGLNQNTLISNIGRLIYTYDDKYILTGSIRRDGSSRFSPDTRWGWFPSVAFAWNIKNEAFLKSTDVVSSLKLRLSYGVTGNQSGISNYSYIPSYYLSDNVSEYQFGDQFYSMYTPNAYDAGLKWEQTGSANVGIDFGFVNNRITGSLDLYNKSTKDLLASVNLPVGTNFTNMIVTNVGSMTSKGIELNLGFIPLRTDKSEWSFNLNASHNAVEITKLTQFSDSSFKGMQTGGIQGVTGQYIQMNNVGREPYSFLVFKQVYNQNGFPIEGAYKDLNGDGIINPGNDQYYYKSPFAKWIFGFSTNYSYKNWSASAVLRSNIGNYLYNNVASKGAIIRNMAINQYLSNATADIKNTNFRELELQSDYYIQNASFLKMDNIGIAYNVGKVFNSHKTNLNINANVQNVFVITKYKGLDPEMSGGIDNNIYPNPRVFTLGLNLNF
jgi:iron complex outermembrane receptor protein